VCEEVSWHFQNSTAFREGERKTKKSLLNRQSLGGNYNSELLIVKY
jgi:hypothetical protein